MSQTNKIPLGTNNEMNVDNDLSNTIRKDISSLVQKQQKIRNKRKSLGSQFGIHHQNRQSLDNTFNGNSLDENKNIDNGDNDSIFSGNQSSIGNLGVLGIYDKDENNNNNLCEDDISLSELKSLIERFGNHAFLFKRVIDDWESIVHTEINQQPPSQISMNKKKLGLEQNNIDIKQICSHPTTVYSDLQEINNQLFKTKEKQEFITTFSNEQFLRQIAELPPSFMNNEDLQFLTEECETARDELLSNKAKLESQNQQLEDISEELIKGYEILSKQVEEAKLLLQQIKQIDNKLQNHKKTQNKMKELQLEFDFELLKTEINENDIKNLEDLKDDVNIKKMIKEFEIKLDSENETLMERWSIYNSARKEQDLTSNNDVSNNKEEDNKLILNKLRILRKILSYKDKLRLTQGLYKKTMSVKQINQYLEGQVVSLNNNRENMTNLLQNQMESCAQLETTAANARRGAVQAQTLAKATGPTIGIVAEWHSKSIDLLDQIETSD